MAVVRKVVRVHPFVLINIVDSYERRNDEARRVIGTLLGNIDSTGAVEVTNAFTVPHNETENEVAVDIEFAKMMYGQYRLAIPSEVIVGWYSTGDEVTEHSVLIHEYYMREAKNPIHILLDTTLKGGKMAPKAFVSIQMGVPGKIMGKMFTPLPLEITSYEPERVALDMMQTGKFNPTGATELCSDLTSVSNACEKLEEMLSSVTQYVNDVIEGKKPKDPTIGRLLMTLIRSVPQINIEEFQNMLNSNMKDLLMVVYLSKLTKTQLIMHEKLSSL